MKRAAAYASVGVAAGLLIAVATVSHADIQADRDLCGSSGPGVAIPNCTWVIKDKTQPPDARHFAQKSSFALQTWRGRRQVSHYNAAIKLVLSMGSRPHGPTAILLAKTYVNRGVARSMRGDTAGALGDYDAARVLDPGLDRHGTTARS